MPGISVDKKHAVTDRLAPQATTIHRLLGGISIPSGAEQQATAAAISIGYRFSFNAWGLGHEVNLGVCNVTNHFNPFMLYFNGTTEEWQEIALLPILPNFSYRISF